ncbi:MAG: lysoplasmalogenase [Acidimicrobiales bacterium]|nr:lysoplasmalogenase [Acidimicrobiales bacterium]
MIALLAVAVAVAFVDWYAVFTDSKSIERLAKPAVLILIFVAHAAGGQLESGYWWAIAVGLVFSLIGDVALLESDRLFEVGLAAFLIAHIAYVIAYIAEGQSTGWLLAGAVVVGLLTALIGRRVAAAARARHGTGLATAVVLYMGALGAMAAFGIGTTSVLLAVGGLLFLASDALLGWGRFVGPAVGGRTAVHVTYHAAQVAIVSGVAR